MSPAVAWVSILALAAAGTAITLSNFGPLISGLYAFGLLLGTVYSIPPLRLKRFAVPAFMIIATVRGFLLNFGEWGRWGHGAFGADAVLHVGEGWPRTYMKLRRMSRGSVTLVRVKWNAPLHWKLLK